MITLKSAVALGFALTAFTANDAWAEPCNGYVVSKALSPITMREAPDGSKVKWIGSEGLFTVLTARTFRFQTCPQTCRCR